jgi:oligosaccharide repeat unit polymerase
MVINYKIESSFLYPPQIFVTLWAFCFIYLILLNEFFYSISEYTLLIFAFGALAFSLGGFLAMCANYKYEIIKSDQTNNILDIILLLILMVLPLYLLKIQNLSSMSDNNSFFIGLRAQTATGLKEIESFGIFGYYLSISIFSALVAFNQCLDNLYPKYKAFVFVALAFLSNLLSAGRTSIVILVFSLVFIYFIKKGIKIKIIFLSIFLTIFMFAVPALVLGKGGSLQSGFFDNLITIKESFQIYLLSGIVAFDQVILNSGEIELYDRSFLFFFNVLNSIGFAIDTPSIVQGYIETPTVTNVYSMYFPYYFDFGFFGLTLVMFFLGFIFTIIYNFAKITSPEFIMLYAITSSYLLLTTFTEQFLFGLSFSIQATLVFVVLYNPSLISFLNKHSMGFALQRNECFNNVKN